MKLRTISLMIMAVWSIGKLYAQQTDPGLTAAIAAQTAVLNNLYDKREKTQEKIIQAEALVTVAMDRVHKVEDKMLEYLSNAQGAMTNLYQIKRAGELVAKEIPSNISLLRKSIPGNLKGTAISLIVSDKIKDITAEMTSLYPFMKQLVTNGSYDVQDINDKGDIVKKKHKVNLLNSAERYYVANEIVSKLESINMSLYLLAWQIRTFSWYDLWYGLDPDGWITIMSGKNIVEGLIYDWKYL